MDEPKRCYTCKFQSKEDHKKHCANCKIIFGYNKWESQRVKRVIPK